MMKSLISVVSDIITSVWIYSQNIYTLICNQCINQLLKKQRETLEGMQTDEIDLSKLLEALVKASNCVYSIYPRVYLWELMQLVCTIFIGKYKILGSKKYQTLYTYYFKIFSTSNPFSIRVCNTHNFSYKRHVIYQI